MMIIFLIVSFYCFQNFFYHESIAVFKVKASLHQKVILLLFLQKPFLGGIAAYQINASLHQKVNGDQEVNGHLKVISPHQPGQSLEVDLRGQNYHTAVVYEFVLCSAVVVALTLLVLWHVRMISFGETNIEVYINRKEVVRLKKLGLVSHNQEVLKKVVASLELSLLGT